MQNYPKILADNITFYRKKKGLTQEALAKKTRNFVSGSKQMGK